MSNKCETCRSRSSLCSSNFLVDWASRLACARKRSRCSGLWENWVFLGLRRRFCVWTAFGVWSWFRGETAWVCKLCIVDTVALEYVFVNTFFFTCLLSVVVCLLYNEEVVVIFLADKRIRWSDQHSVKLIYYREDSLLFGCSIKARSSFKLGHFFFI